MLITRYDTVPIRDASIDPQTKFLTVKRVPIARTGVFPYSKADGSIDYEAKRPEDLLSPETVASANNKPVTNDHPQGLVTKDNAEALMKGFTANNAHVEGNYLFNDLTIYDSALINAIKNGKRELSIGFQTELSPESGELNGVKYDTAQKNIRINHVAVVDRGRAGHSVRLVGDSAEMVNQKAVSTKKGQNMDTTKVRLDGSDVTVAVDDADKITKLDADNAKNKKQIETLTAAKKALQNQIDELQGKEKAAEDKADAAEKSLADYKKKFDGDSLDKRVQERLDLIGVAKNYLGDSYDFKGKSAKDIKIDTIKKVRGDSVDLKDKSDGFIDGYFEGLGTKKPHKVNGYAGQQYKGDSAQAQLQKLLDSRYTLADRKRKEAEK